MAEGRDWVGEFKSPGGFVFGVSGWTWGDQRPTSMTFFLDGTARVFDQHGRPIKGIVDTKTNKAIYFEKCSHAQVITALAEERIDWLALTCAGWPQLPYDQLKTLENLPPTPVSDLQKIKDSVLRKDALRIRREVDEAKVKELQAIEAE